jgi:hypothetical protein
VTPKNFPAHTPGDVDEERAALLHDVGVAAFDENLNSVGLATREGQRKKGYLAFQEWSRSPR